MFSSGMTMLHPNHRSTNKKKKQPHKTRQEKLCFDLMFRMVQETLKTLQDIGVVLGCAQKLKVSPYI